MRKNVKSVVGDRVQTVQFALADFDKSRLLCRTHVMMLHSEFCAVWLSLSDVTGKKNIAH